MKQVFVLGNGQLGRMLRQAAEPLSVTVWPVDENTLAGQLPPQPDVITAEIERWPHSPLMAQLEQHPAFINRQVFPLIADRLTQKQLLDDADLPTAKWQLLTDAPCKLFTTSGEKLVVKRRTGGYDGRGQWHITADNTATLPADCYGNCIVEQRIDFSAEVSLIAARDQQGKCVFYPLSHNLHQGGILRASVAFPASDSRQQHQAQVMLSTIMQRLNYTGVMAMECFVTPRGLLINELAPRVHNSGHWTQNAASISQFELHLRAILGLPVAQPEISQPSVMINLIGCELNYQWLEIPHLHLHWYDKVVRDGRKVGHLNLTAPCNASLRQALQPLLPLLPPDYTPVIQWAQNKLQ